LNIVFIFPTRGISIISNSGYVCPMKISLVRVVGDFYPVVGGSITHIIELSKAIDPFLEKQMIIAPQYKIGNSTEFDEKFPILIQRIDPSFLNSPQFQKIPGTSLINIFFYYTLKVSLTIKKIMKKGYHIDIVQVHFNILGLLLSFWFKIFEISLPIIIMHHGSSVSPEKDTQFGKFLYKLVLFLFKWFKPDYYIQLDDGTTNNQFYNELNTLQIPYKTVYHAINTEFYQHLPIDYVQKEFIVLSNHRLVPFKRVDLSIIAFKLFLEREGYPLNVKLRIIGSGPLKRDLETLVEKNQINSYVDFAGEKKSEDYNKELAFADIIIGTSLISNCNRSIQEAMAYGKPVIVFDSISPNDLFLDMENCILIPPGDLERFANSIELLYKDLLIRTNLGKNARKTIIDRRNWKNRVEQELSIYSEIISKHASKI